MTKPELFKLLIINDLFKDISFFDGWCEIVLVEGKNKTHLRIGDDTEDIEIINFNFQVTIACSKLTERWIKSVLELGEIYEN